MWRARTIGADSQNKPLWYVDDLQHEPIRVGAGDPGAKRAEQLSEVLNFGHAVGMRRDRYQKFTDALRVHSDSLHALQGHLQQLRSLPGEHPVAEDLLAESERALRSAQAIEDAFFGLEGQHEASR